MKNRKLVIYAMATLLIAIAVNNIVLTEPSPPGVIPFPPTVTTNLATNVTHNSATLNGTVNPNGFDTMTYFEWSETIPYGNSTPFQFIGSGVVNVDVMAGISGLSANTTYNYRIVASNLGGTSYGLNQAFTTLLPPLPEQVTSPEPMNGAINVIITPILSWAIASGATSYDVYFGTTPALLFVTNTTETNYNPGTLNYNTTYYWRIDSRNAYGTTTGNLWSFTTQMSPPVPIAPSNLIATAVSHNQIDLVWQDNSDNEDAFNIERRTLDTPYSRIATLGADSTTYSDTGLEPSTTYFYCVNASNVAGNSPYSNESCATTMPVILVPNAPTNLVATTISSSQINLTWQDNSDNEQGFKIERKTPIDESFVQIATVNANVTSYSDTGLSPGMVYYYRVKAYNEFGDSDYSNMFAAVTFADLPTADKTIALFTTYYQEGLIKNHGIYNSLIVKLNASQYSIYIKDYTTAIKQLNALRNELWALKEESIDHVARIKLIVSAQSLIEYLNLLNSLPATIELYPPETPFVNKVTIEIPGGGDVVTTLTGNLTVRIASTDISNVASVTIMHSAYVMEPIIVNGINFGTLYISQNPNNPSVGTLNLQTGEINIVEKVLVTSSYLDLLGLSPVPIEIPQTGTFSPLSLEQGWGCLVGHGNLPTYLPILGGGIFFSLSFSGKDVVSLVTKLIKMIIGDFDIKKIWDILKKLGTRNSVDNADAWNLIEKLRVIFATLSTPKTERKGAQLESDCVEFLQKLSAITGLSCCTIINAPILADSLDKAYPPEKAKEILKNIEEFQKGESKK